MVEIGVNGYSTLWLAAAAQAYGGRVTSLDVLQAKTALARNTLSEAGLLDTVTLVTAEADGSWLRQQAAESAQLIFWTPTAACTPAIGRCWPRCWRRAG